MQSDLAFTSHRNVVQRTLTLERTTGVNSIYSEIRQEFLQDVWRTLWDRSIKLLSREPEGAWRFGLWPTVRISSTTPVRPPVSRRPALPPEGKPQAKAGGPAGPQ